MGWRAAGAPLALAWVALLIGGCMGTRSLDTAPRGLQAMSATRGAAPAEGSDNGAGGQLPAFYDGDRITINIFELSDKATESLTAHNRNLNEIYVTNDLDDPQDFDPVIDAVPGDGFNPMWKQLLIHFAQGVSPHQFTSEEEVDAAVDAGQITLEDTGEIYRCAVVGTK